MSASGLRLPGGKQLNRLLRFLALGVLVVIFVLGMLFYAFEHGHNSNVTNIRSAFRWSLLGLLQNQAPFDAKTAAGTALEYVSLFSGLLFLAAVVTVLSAKVVERMDRNDVGKVRHSMHGHILICGWNDRGPEILRELNAKEVDDKRPIVVLSTRELHLDHPRVTVVHGNAAQEVDLHRAGVTTADSAIILADQTHPGATADDRDGHTLLVTLAVEALNPNVYTCVEVLRSENRRHLERTHADELLVTSEMAGALLASSAITHGLSRIVADLVTHPEGNEFVRIDLPPDLAGKAFLDVMIEMKKRRNCVAIAIARADGGYELNPDAKRAVDAADGLLVISLTP